MRIPKQAQPIFPHSNVVVLNEWKPFLRGKGIWYTAKVGDGLIQKFYRRRWRNRYQNGFYVRRKRVSPSTSRFIRRWRKLGAV